MTDLLERLKSRLHPGVSTSAYAGNIASAAYMPTVTMTGTVGGVDEDVQDAITRIKALEAVAVPARELLFLYDWRFELAKREKDHANVVGVDSNVAWLAEGDEIKRLLREYGERKKAGWIALRSALGKLG